MRFGVTDTGVHANSKTNALMKVESSFNVNQMKHHVTQYQLDKSLIKQKASPLAFGQLSHLEKSQKLLLVDNHDSFSKSKNFKSLS
jgi:hypothetical protein